MANRKLQYLRDQYEGLDEFEITRDRDGDLCLWGSGEYPEHSVLAGQYRSHVLEYYDSLEEAQKAHPAVPVNINVRQAPPAGLRVPDVAPPGFDPADAGERWDEEY